MNFVNHHWQTFHCWHSPWPIQFWHSFLNQIGWQFWPRKICLQDVTTEVQMKEKVRPKPQVFLSMSIFIKFWGRENNTFFCVEERGVASIYFICLQVHLRNKTFNGLRMNKKVWASCTIFFLDGSWKGKLLTLKWFLFQELLRASSFHVKLWSTSLLHEFSNL